MHIASLTVENFRNIESIEIDMQTAPITVLVGENAVGKSTLLNAIRLLFVATAPRTHNEHVALGRDLGALAPDNQNILLNDLQGDPMRPVVIRSQIRLTQEEIEFLRQQAHSAALYRVAASRPFASDFDLHNYIASDGREHFDESLRAINEYLAGVNPETDVLVVFRQSPRPDYIETGMHDCTLAIMRCLFRRITHAQASLVTMFPADRMITSGWGSLNLAEGQLRQNLEAHLASPQNKYQKVKDYLIAQHLADTEQLSKDLSTIFSDLLSGKAFEGLCADGHGRIRALIRDSRSGRTFDLDSMSSGEKSAVLSFFMCLRMTARNGVCLFDEPELHLSPEACRKIVPFLYNRMVGERNVQVIACTHSPDVLGDAYESDCCNLVHLVGPSRVESVSSRPKLALEALKSLGLRTDEFLFSRGTIFVEGFDDVHLLEEGFRELPELKGMRFRSVGGVENLKKDIEILQKKESEGAFDDVEQRYVFIRDADGMSDTLQSTEKVRAITWRRYDIESYLVDHEALFEVLANSGCAKSPSTGGELKEKIAGYKRAHVREIAIDTVLRQRMPVQIKKSKIVCEDFKTAAAIACDEFRGLKERVLEMSELDTDEFELECTRQFDSLWEAEQAQPFSVVKGKEIIRKVKAEYGPRVSPLQFKVKIMKCLRNSESKSWREMRNELVAGVTARLSSQ